MKALSLNEQIVLMKYQVFDKEAELAKFFMEKGPSKLCVKLGISSFDDPSWEVIFDYFVIHKNIFLTLAKRYFNHFKELYEEHGPSRLREMLFLKAKKYDHIWRPLHDLVGIADDSLIKYVYNNRFSVNRLFHVHGAAYLRKYLFIEHKNYDETWQSILDILLQTTTQGYFSRSVMDQGLNLFTATMNFRRFQRAIGNKKTL